MRAKITTIYWRTLAVFVLLTTVGYLFIYAEAIKHVEAVKQSALQIASAEASVLSQRLNASISLTYTLEALLREKHFEIDQETLDEFSSHLLNSHASVSSLQYAPKGIVTYISPLAGNEAAIGHNLLEDPKRNKEAYDAVEKRILTVAGPFKLVQGGVALVARLPIFQEIHGTEEFWGFSTVLMKIDDLMASITIDNLTTLGYAWNIYRIHPDTKQPQVFYGPAREVLADSVQLAINAPNATWYLSLKPSDGWLASHYAFIFKICVICLVVSFIISYLSFKLFKYPYELKEQVEIRTAELNRAKNVLAQSEQRFMQIAENNQMWIWETDDKGLYTYCSDACRHILGFSADEIIGKKYFYDLFHPQDRSELKEAALQVFKQRRPFNDFENRNINKAGETVWLSTSGVPILGKESQLIGYRGSDIDITQRKKLAEEHGRAAQLAVLGTVAAGVAHEINNPINGVINYAELLKTKANQPEAVLDIAARIAKESERIAKITQDLLHYSKDTRYELRPVNIKEAIEGALSLIVPKIKGNGILVTASIPDDLPAVYGNAQSIQQIIINLVDNAYDALRYKEDMKEDKVINIACGLDGPEDHRRLCMTVIDNGIGMSSNVIKKAKDAFFTTKTSLEGSGLGLSIVNEIVGRHHGLFHIESIEGEHTKVTVCLPLPGQAP